MFDPNFEDLLTVMARDGAVRKTHEGRALDLALSVIAVLGERGTITGADVCSLAAAFGYDAAAIASAWTTRCAFEAEPRSKALDAPLAHVLPLG